VNDESFSVKECLETILEVIPGIRTIFEISNGSSENMDKALKQNLADVTTCQHHLAKALKDSSPHAEWVPELQKLNPIDSESHRRSIDKITLFHRQVLRLARSPRMGELFDNTTLEVVPVSNVAHLNPLTLPLSLAE